MSDPEDDVFDDEALDAWIRAHPEVWHYADDGPEISDHSIERLIDRALERRGGVLRRRKRRRLVTAGLVGGLILAGGTAAAVLTRSGQPQAPETGAICRPSGVEGGGGVVIDPGADPIAECRRRWERGEFEELVGSSGVPELVACIGAAGVINVFPGPVDLCERLGLQPADAELDAESLAIVELHDRVAEEINRQECQPALAVAEQTQALLTELGFSDWRIVQLGDPATNDCAKVGIDSATKTINIIET